MPIALAIAVAVLLIDDYTPQEMPPQFLYVLCVLVAVWAHRERTIWGIAVLCTFLTLLGSYLSPPSFDMSIILFNRSTAIILIWLTAVLVWRYRRAQDTLRLLNKELEARVAQRTQELSRSFDEREQLNRDLHDDVLQSLYAVGLELEAGRSSSFNDPGGVIGHIDRTLHQLKHVMQQIRNYIAGFHPSRQDALDIALAALVKDMTIAQGPHMHLTMDPGVSDSLSPEQTESILLIVREALSNCVRHSRAQQGFVTAQGKNGAVLIEIQDDGVGFDPDAAKKDGHGLANMAARARAIGAEFTIVSWPGHGVHIALDVPLQPRGVRP
ncbi:MAG: sensor histidine kinase [Nitrospiraceae bacterium]